MRWGSRRVCWHYVFLWLAVYCSIALFNLARLASAADARPNILFFFADDWGRHAGVYARVDANHGINDIIRTPTIDRVASQGVVFRNAFVNAPSCTPCRSSLLSGQYFWRTGRGAVLHAAVWDSAIPVYSLLLKDTGYQLGKSYKVWSPGTPADAPYGKQQYAFERAGRKFNRFSQEVTQLVAAGTPREQAKDKLLSEVRENFGQFLAQRDPNKPFCYWFGPTNTHRKWVRGSGKALWDLNPDDLQGKLPPFLPDVAEVREDITDYFGEAMALDAALAVLIQSLRDQGLYENTLIVISGDHGAPGFPHGKCNLYDFGTRVPLIIAGPKVVPGRVVDDFASLPDLAPTFLEAGGCEIPAVMTAKSLWPVLLSDAQGQVDPNRTWVLTGRERHVSQARADFLPYPQRCLRTAKYAFITNFHPERMPLGDLHRLESDTPPSFDEIENSTYVTLPDEDAGLTKAWLVTHRNDSQWKPYFDHAYGKRPREELFDLEKDPHQMHNVAALPEYATVLAELRSQLLNELQRSGDPRMIDDGKYYETPPLAGPFKQ
ncbi:MAG: sulfatase [Planctomycetales bacterium]|nr:sulfatase [Planctomycetales bacterium]